MGGGENEEGKGMIAGGFNGELIGLGILGSRKL